LQLQPRGREDDSENRKRIDDNDTVDDTININMLW
jgi:hypothetical protein